MNMAQRVIDALRVVVSCATAASKTTPEQRAAIRFMLAYDIRRHEADTLIDALGIAEAERRLKRAKELGVDIFHPSVMGAP